MLLMLIFFYATHTLCNERSKVMNTKEIAKLFEGATEEVKCLVEQILATFQPPVEYLAAHSEKDQ